MIWLVLVIISAISSSFTRTIQKYHLAKHPIESVTFSFGFQLLVGILMISWAAASGFKFPSLLPLLPNLILMSVLYTFGNVFLFKAFKRTDISEAAIIYSLNLVWSVLTAVIFLNESFDFLKIVGVILIFLGITVIQNKNSRWNLSIGHMFALLASLFHGVAFTNDAFILNYFESVPSYMVLAFIFPAILTFFFIQNKPENLPKLYNFKSIKFLVVASVFYSVSAVSVFTAYKLGGEASVISPISQMSLLFTVLFGYLFLKERDNLIQKILGSLIALIGVVALSIKL